MRSFVRSAVFVGAVLCACGPTQQTKAEICNNAVDDDGNGKVDCADPACASDPQCDAGDGGHRVCQTQADCLVQSWSADHPPMACLGARCTSQGDAVALHFIAKTTNITWPGTFRSMSTRFISKVDVDNGSVTCSRLSQLATGTTAADADQLERNGKFNYLAFDVIGFAQGISQPTAIENPFLYTAMGGNFLIWNELWTQAPNPDTRLPQGTRMVANCFETGIPVAPIVAADDCAGADAGTCRTITVSMSGP